MVIVSDIDNTIEDLLTAWTDAVNARFGTDVHPYDIKEWDVMKAYPTLNPADVFARVKDEGFWKKVQPIDGAAYYLKKLMDDGHEVYLCSATDFIDIRPKYEDLIHRCFPFIPWDRIIICYHKQLLRADVMIDDAVHNLEGGSYVKMLYSQAHNISYPAEENGMIRVNSWQEIYERITDLARRKTENDTI